MSGVKPTHELVVRDDETGDYGKIGVGWQNKEGGISIRLNPCSVVTYDSLKGKTLTLFPVKTKEEWAAWHARKNAVARQATKDSEQTG